MKSLVSNLKIFFAAVLGIVAMSSCTELTLSETSHESPAKGDFFSFQIKTNKSWTMEMDSLSESWINISQEAGNGDATIEVNISTNLQFDKERHGAIKIKTADNFYVVDIKQLGPKEPSFSADTLFFTSDEQSKTLTINSEISVCAHRYGNWFEISQQTSSDASVIECTISVKENYLKDPSRNILADSRESTIRFEAGNSFTKDIVVVQDSKQFNESGDLGLSVEWATKNVGAESSFDNGSFFSIDEVETMEKDGWRVPTYHEWDELYKKCKRYVRYKEEPNIYAGVIVGTNHVPYIEFVAENGNAIRFRESYPALFYKHNTSQSKVDEEKTIEAEPIALEPGEIPKIDYTKDYESMIYGDGPYSLISIDHFGLQSENYYKGSGCAIRLVRDKK